MMSWIGMMFKAQFIMPCIFSMRLYLAVALLFVASTDAALPLFHGWASPVPICDASGRQDTSDLTSLGGCGTCLARGKPIAS
jgi:hypothetical protein